MVRERLLHEELHLGRPDLGKDVRVEVKEDLTEEIERFLLVLLVSDRIVVGEETGHSLKKLP